MILESPKLPRINYGVFYISNQIKILQAAYEAMTKQNKIYGNLGMYPLDL